MSDENMQAPQQPAQPAPSVQPQPQQPQQLAQAQPPQPAPSAQPQPAQPAQPQQPAPSAQSYARQPVQQPAAAAGAAIPQVVIPAPLTKLTGGMKFGWFVVGALLGIPGILIAWLANADRFAQVKNDAIKFSAIGMAVWAVLWVVVCLMFLGVVAAATVHSGGTSSYYYGSYF